MYVRARVQFLLFSYLFMYLFIYPVAEVYNTPVVFTIIFYGKCYNVIKHKLHIIIVLSFTSEYTERAMRFE